MRTNKIAGEHEWSIRRTHFLLLQDGRPLLKINRKHPRAVKLGEWCSDRWGVDLINGASTAVTSGLAGEIRHWWRSSEVPEGQQSDDEHTEAWLIEEVGERVQDALEDVLGCLHTDGLSAPAMRRASILRRKLEEALAWCLYAEGRRSLEAGE